MQLKRPILVGGLGLSASLWLLNIVGHSPVGHALGDGSALMGAIALGTGLWFFKRNKQTELVVAPPLSLGIVDKAAIEQVIAEIEATISTIIIEEKTTEEKSDSTWIKSETQIEDPVGNQVENQVEKKRAAIAQLRQNLEREQLSLAIVGNKSTGKTSLKEHLTKHWQTQQKNIETITEFNGEEVLPATESDLVLFVTAGDLTQSELKHIQTLLKAGYRIQIAFN